MSLTDGEGKGSNKFLLVSGFQQLRMFIQSPAFGEFCDYPETQW